jgi:hypothetical protein
MQLTVLINAAPNVRVWSNFSVDLHQVRETSCTAQNLYECTHFLHHPMYRARIVPSTSSPTPHPPPHAAQLFVSRRRMTYDVGEHCGQSIR